MKIYRQVICKQLFHTLFRTIIKNIVVLNKYLADVDYNCHIVDNLMYGRLLLTYFFRNTDLKATFRVRLGMRWKLFPLLKVSKALTHAQ